MSGTHWGEIPKIPIDDFFIPDVTADIESSMSECCLSEYEGETENTYQEDITLPPMDPVMMYAIALHKYAANMTEMIKVAEVAIESKIIPPDTRPVIPKMPKIEFKHKPNPLNFIPPDMEQTNEDIKIPELSEVVVKKILAKCIATMFAHIGFESSFQSVLDILIDMLEKFYLKVCGRFVQALDEEESLKTGGFPNALERVLVESGLGGVKGLNDYYQCRVLKYVNVLQRRCKELDNYYSQLLAPRGPPQESAK
ncbi:uncharacterized protein LOC132701784 [Cylas formicarius]|uniref:uncharacterized protein LOC132701784 n=1 Tax=Cylas formicarius TaxID=197179 RepID=UPI002958831E|nr:uncharacterized protein LOC132701784 [Cylas formicarius]